MHFYSLTFLNVSAKCVNHDLVSFRIIVKRTISDLIKEIHTVVAIEEDFYL